MKAATVLLILTLFYTGAGSQSIPRYEFGISTGVIVYQGDLTPHILGDPYSMKPALMIYGSRIINRRFAIRLNYSIGKLKGDDSKYDKPGWRKQRNYFFSSPVSEIAGLLTWNIGGLIPNAAGIVNFTPYLFAGAGYSFLNIKRDWSSFNDLHFSDQANVSAGLKEDIQHDLPSGVLVLPIGFGMRLGLTPNISLSAETSYRHSFTDYIDGFSRGANPNLKDHYYTHSIGIIYTPGKHGKMECPNVKL